jgi:hypothetical protein
MRPNCKRVSCFVLQFTAILKIVCRQTSDFANAGVALFAPWNRVAQAILFGVQHVSLLLRRFTITSGSQLHYDRQPDYFPLTVWTCSSKAAFKI